MKQLRLSPSTKEGGIVVAVKVGHHDRWAITRGVGHCHQSEESQQLRRNALSYFRQDRAEFMPLSLKKDCNQEERTTTVVPGGAVFRHDAAFCAANNAGRQFGPMCLIRERGSWNFDQ
jgi:hypothetical protein